MKKRKLLTIFGIIILLILILYSLFSNSKSVTQTKTEIIDQYSVAEKRDIIKTLTALGEVESAKTENLKLNKSYYFQTMCAEKNEIIKAGDKILKYINGKFLIAPYDCIITEYYVPKINSICTDSNYVKIASIDELNMKINISENELSKISVGQEVEIKINYDEMKTYTGTITKINEIGTSSINSTNFSSIVSLKNDGNLKPGMSAICTITIEKNEKLLCVPIEAVSIENNERYVNAIKNGNYEKTLVTTGIADANYVQILSGISENDEIYYQTSKTIVEENEEESTDKNLFESLLGGNRNSRGGKR